MYFCRPQQQNDTPSDPFKPPLHHLSFHRGSGRKQFFPSLLLTYCENFFRLLKYLLLKEKSEKMSSSTSTSKSSSGTTSASTAASTISHITYPITEPQASSSSADKESQLMEKRLWLGNLDPKLTEFHLLKLVQKYGSIEQFDFLFHRSGPNTGLPRGYAFVEFKERSSAERCMDSMNGKRVLERFMTIRWAHQVVKEYPDEQTKLRAKLPGLAVKESDSAGAKLNKEKAINAIEAKLMAMEREKDHLTLNIATNKPSSSSNNSNVPFSRNTHFVHKSYSSQSQQHNRYKQTDRNKKPYSR